MARRKVKKETKAEVELVEQKPQSLKWKVKNGGITLLDKRSYTKGETFEATEEEVPKAFRDSLQLLSEVVTVNPSRVEKVRYSSKELEPSEEEKEQEGYVQLYAIVDGNDKVVSESPLTKEKVDEFLKLLNR